MAGNELAGDDVLVMIDLAGDGSNYVVVASQRGATFEETNATQDFSSKNTRFSRFRYGRISWTCNMSHLYVPDDQSLAHLKHAARYGQLVVIRRQERGQATEEADAMIVTRSEDFPDNAEATVSVSFQGASEWRSAA